METIGDDKKIRALFSETRFVDEQTAPSFTATWSHAQARALKPRRAFNLSFAVATALLVCALASLALWSKYQTGTTLYTAFATVPAGSIASPPQIKYGSQTGVLDVQAANHPRVKARRMLTAQRNALTLAANRKAEQKTEQEAKQLASWQSPTASLLSSSSDSLFKSLPQLNENSTELKSFLPNRENEKEK
jgi:uncharacterized protein (DUF885 family)